MKHRRAPVSSARATRASRIKAETLAHLAFLRQGKEKAGGGGSGGLEWRQKAGEEVKGKSGRVREAEGEREAERRPLNGGSVTLTQPPV